MLAASIHLSRGTPYIYMGEEIGMIDPDYDSMADYVDVESINAYQMLLDQGKSPEQAFKIIQAKSRDNSRTPMQWDASLNAGFSTGTPWLKVGKSYKDFNVEKEMDGPIFTFYKELIRLRKEMRIISEGSLSAFIRHLRTVERSAGTIEKYFRDTGRFAAWLEGAEATRERTAAWRDSLLEGGYAPATVNSMVAAVNQFFTFLGWDECKVKALKIQRKLFRDDRRELTREEYQRLLEAAHGLGRERLALLLETICATGIRVSEVKYITVEAAHAGRAEISLKGKLRTILLPGKLCRKLKKYARAQKTASGEIFLTRSGKSLSRRQIWAEMKRLCRAAGVAPSKVFPHNLRHLFARTFYKVCRDVVKLADVLGHSSIETTRIYLISTGAEHAGILRKMRLIL